MILSAVWLSLLLSICNAAAHYGGSKEVWDFRGQSTDLDRMNGEAPDSAFGSVVATVDLISIVGSPSE